MQRDAVIELTISPDNLFVYGNFIPHAGDGRPLSVDYMHSVLEIYDIVYGIQHDELGEIIFEVNTGRRIRNNVLVARGKPPVEYRAAFYNLIQPKEKTNPTPAATDSGRVDFKRMSRLPVVRRGQAIARRVEARPGEAGINVKGEEIPFASVPVESLSPGKNTISRDGVVYAKKGGQLRTSDSQFFVEDRLEIKTDVGFATGSIEFPGDIVLKGEIRDGFHVWAGGSIAAAATVDVSQIYCRKDFICSGGLVGHGSGVLRCGGRVQAKFVENCQLESKSAVHVKQYCYHARVSTLDHLTTGKTGRVVAGVVTAGRGIHCSSLGNKAEIPTVVRAGLDFIVDRKIHQCKEKLESLSTRIAALTRNDGVPLTDSQQETLDMLKASQDELTEEMSELTERLDLDEEAEIIVTGEIFRGVQVQICQATMTVEKNLNKVRFVLDKTTGRVLIRNIKEKK